MIWVMCKIICLILIGSAVAVVVETFIEDYQDGGKGYLAGDAIVIIWLVANAVLLIMWM